MPAVVLMASAILGPRPAINLMNGKTQPTRVEIYGQNYNVRGEGDPAYLTELAQYVDARMREVASEVSTVDPVKIAILAALNIADELHRQRDRSERVSGIWMNRTRELARRLDVTLGEAGE